MTARLRGFRGAGLRCCLRAGPVRVCCWKDGKVGLAAAFDGVLTAVGFPYSITAAMDVRDR
jgi:hypothetical protein